ncbi:hypothetical protein [Streptomyces rubiginosohelvolus]|uniref:hypothetical protein n=1 Tax=Streptomyces rubiginosohelvolus TaxID=67362 RepID=UPI0033A3E790
MWEPSPHPAGDHHAAATRAAGLLGAAVFAEAYERGARLDPEEAGRQAPRTADED